MLIDTKARVGVFAVALGAYLPQFPSLVPEFEAQYAAFRQTLPATVEAIDGGIITTKELASAAGDKFRAADVDLVIVQLLTYATSYNVLPAVRDLNVPVVLVNVQKKRAPDYAHTDTPTWLGELYACGAVGEMVADLERAGKRHAVITGVVEGGDPAVQAEIAAALAEQGTPPAGDADLILSVYRSLAAGYGQAVRQLEELTGRRWDTLYIAGGGAKNALLNDLTAKATGKRVAALPIEATAIGNLKLQMQQEV